VDGPLFYDGELRDVLEHRKGRLRDTVTNWKGDEFLQLSPSDLVSYLIDDFSLEAPQLDLEGQHALPPKDVNIDVSQDWQRAIFDRSTPTYVQGTQVTVIVPFSGDAQLFKYTPTTRSTYPPRGTIQGNQLHINVEQIGMTGAQAASKVRHALEHIEKYLAWVAGDVQTFHNELASEAERMVEHRRQKLLADRELEKELGIPVKRRETAPVVIPMKQKRVRVERPRATGNFQPEPALSESDYEAVISIILNLGTGFERSPRTFAKLDEEELRDHILLQLNGTFEGQAGAEMFNGEGKTDVLVRTEDRNVFIGECKFWTGQKAFGKALDQLLGYLVWRDTKGALIVFIKQKDVSTIIEKADAVIREHANFKRASNAEDPERRRDYVLHPTGDPNREIRLAFLPMPIPASARGPKSSWPPDRKDSSS
jgi:hypothetical protein